MNKHNGTPRKIMNSSCLKELGWNERTKFKAGLKLALDWFLKSHMN